MDLPGIDGMDDDDLLAELEGLEQEDLAAELSKVELGAPSGGVAMPAAPTSQPLPSAPSLPRRRTSLRRSNDRWPCDPASRATDASGAHISAACLHEPRRLQPTAMYRMSDVHFAYLAGRKRAVRGAGSTDLARCCAQRHGRVHALAPRRCMPGRGPSLARSSAREAGAAW